MRKRKYLIVFLICIIAALSSCSFKNLTPSELLKPPATAVKIKQVEEDIKKAIPEETFPVIPVSGEYRSSINFVDLNNDKKDEVVYIYSTTIEKTNPSICVMSKENDHYVKKYTLNSIAVGIDFISFTDYNFDESVELSIGYLQANTEQKLLSVYNISTPSPIEILNSTYNIQALIKKADNSNYIFIAALTTKDLPARGKLFEYSNEKFSLISQCEMNGAISSYASIITDINKDKMRIVINENIDSTTLSTEVITISEKKLINNTFSNGKPLFQSQLMRSSNIYAQDIDKDGTIEFPTAIQSQAKIQTAQSLVKVSEWFTFDNDKFTSKMHLAINTAERYYVIFPEKWLSIVTIKTDVTGSNYSFYYKTAQENEELLFSIMTMSQRDYDTKKADSEYGILKQLPDRVYAAFIPKTISSVAKNTQPTLQDLEKIFVQTTIKQR